MLEGIYTKSLPLQPHPHQPHTVPSVALLGPTVGDGHINEGGEGQWWSGDCKLDASGARWVTQVLRADVR